MPIKHYSELRAKPDLKKQTFSSQQKHFTAAVTHMCGWRKTMEDADIFDLDIDGKGTNLLAVFDGHGGAQVAIFSKRHYKRLLM